jgi:hypothetical protein
MLDGLYCNVLLAVTQCPLVDTRHLHARQYLGN